MLQISVKRSDLPRLLNHDCVPFDSRGNLIEERRGLLNDEDFDARRPITLALAGADYAWQRHQAIGVLLEDLLDGLVEHGLFFRTLLPARHRNVEQQGGANHAAEKACDRVSQRYPIIQVGLWTRLPQKQGERAMALSPVLLFRNVAELAKQY